MERKKNEKKKPKNKKKGKKIPTLVPKASLDMLVKYVQQQRQLHILKGGNPSTFKLSRRDIPFWEVIFGKGTQAPTIRLYRASLEISVVAATTYNTVASLRLDGFLNYSDYANVFDEYRPLRAEFDFHPSQSWDSMSVHTVVESNAVGVIDYDDATALASFDAGIARDNKKIFQMIGIGGATPKAIHWPVQFDWLPDSQWVTTATVTTVFASWKPYLTSSHGYGNRVAGYLLGWCDFQFRGSI